MTCVIKNVEDFCSKFVSINLSMSTSSGPSLEVSVIGSPESSDHESLSSTILKELEDFSINLGNSESWELVSVKTSKSSSGVITTCYFIDSLWLAFSGYYVAPGTPELGPESFADVTLGRELFSVTGTANSRWDGRQRDILMDGDFLWGNGRNYDRLNSGQAYINLSGGITHQSVYTLSNIGKDTTIAQLRQNHVPGIPHPKIEFGTIYYNVLGSKGLIKRIQDFLLATAKKTVQIEGASGMNGKFNDSGTFFDVLSGIGSAYGRSFVANSFWGARFFQSDDIVGTIEAMQDAGISVPENAISSSQERDYSMAVRHDNQRVNRRPGRHPRIDQDIVYDPSGTTPVYSDDGGQRLVPIEGFESGEVGLSQSINFGAEASDRELAWLLVGDHPIFEEIGLATAISYGTQFPNQAWAEDIYGMGGTYYIGVNAQIKSNNIPSLARQQMGVQGTATDAHLCTFMNNKRIWYTTQINHKDISMQGDVDGSTPILQDPETFGFDNAGTAETQLGSRTWNTTSGGSLSFIPGSADLGMLGVDCGAYDKGTTVSGASGASSDEASIRSGVGIVAVDYGPIDIPSIAGIDVDFMGLECKIDNSPSVRAEGGAKFGGIASIHLQSLINIGNAYLNSVAQRFTNAKARRAQGASAMWHGRIISGHAWASSSPRGKGGTGTTYNKLSSEAQKKAMTSKMTVLRHSSYQSCSSNIDLPNWPTFTQASLLNRSVNHSSVDYAWREHNEKHYIELDEGGRATVLAYNMSCAENPLKAVPFIEKQSFSLVNEMIEINSDNLKYLESMSINIVDGKLTSNYSFSEKIKVRDHRKLATALTPLKVMLNK